MSMPEALREAVEKIGGNVSRDAIREYIHTHYPNQWKSSTFNTLIYACTVNNPKAYTHHPYIKKFLFKHPDGSFEIYRPDIHGEENATEHLGKSKRIMHMDSYHEKVIDILCNANKYHSAFYAAEPFRGPSLYFHRRSIQTRHSDDFIRHLEYIYATLTSWGMHRMGRGGAKMQPFDIFLSSIEPKRKKIKDASRFDHNNMTEGNWRQVEEIFCSIKIMTSGTSLVGNSKVMAHLIPNIVPPIDRAYTLNYLRGNTNIKNDLAFEWALMKEIISDFFIPVAKDPEFKTLAAEWMAEQDQFPWDTSIFKVIDNLVIGAKNQ